MSVFDGEAAQCDGFTGGKTATSWYLTVSGVGVSLAALPVRGFPLPSAPSSSFTCSDQESQARQQHHDSVLRDHERS